MKKIIIVTLMILMATAVFAQGKSASAPGQDPRFYRGITTYEPVVTVETSVTQNVTETVETRVIGSGQFNNKKDGNLQDRTITEIETVTTVTTTSVTESHRGAPVSNGKQLEPVVVVTQEVESSVETVVGDWGPAYDVPSEVK